MRTRAELKNAIIADLKIELQDDATFSETKLGAKVIAAITEVQTMRNYQATSMTNEQIEDDLWNYYSNIKNVALYDYNQMGAEYEGRHSENGISRSYMSRSSLFNGVCPFIKVFG